MPISKFKATCLAVMQRVKRLLLDTHVWLWT